MYSEDDLDAAVAGGALTSEAVSAFRDFTARRRLTAPADEESFRLITGFNDIFVSIAAVLLLLALGWLGALAGTVLGPALVAAASWAFAEYFTRRRRMALPSIVLLGGFVGGVFAAGLALLGQTHAAGLAGVDGFRQIRLDTAGGAAAAALAAYAHWRRFRVPITVAAGAVAVAATVLALLGLALGPDLPGGILPLVFLAGLALFALAMGWDMSDRERRTRRSDVAFWLHLAAAPLLVHPVFSTLGAGIGNAVTAVALYVGLAVVALAVDRRALLVSALFYVLYAMSALFKAAGSFNQSFALTALIIGSALLLLSAFWHHARRLVVALVPAGLRRRLPPST